MDKNTLAILIQEGGKVVSEVIRNRDLFSKPAEETITEEIPSELSAEESISDEKATGIATGCIPCSLGHFSACSGLLNEAMRFARSDGVQSGEVIDRVNMCMDELIALIRVDLRPEMIINLPPGDKELANELLISSRGISHELEGIDSVGKLEHIAAQTQTLRQKVGRQWFQQRLSQMSPEQRKSVESELKESDTNA